MAGDSTRIVKRKPNVPPDVEYCTLHGPCWGVGPLMERTEFIATGFRALPVLLLTNAMLMIPIPDPLRVPAISCVPVVRSANPAPSVLMVLPPIRNEKDVPTKVTTNGTRCWPPEPVGAVGGPPLPAHATKNNKPGALTRVSQDRVGDIR